MKIKLLKIALIIIFLYLCYYIYKTIFLGDFFAFISSVVFIFLALVIIKLDERLR